MKIRLALFAALCVVIAAGVAALTTGAARAQAAGGTHYYLALGDSLARSAQPNGDFQHGYAEQLLALLQQQDPSLRLVKLGCGGATTADMIYGSDDPSCARRLAGIGETLTAIYREADAHGISTAEAAERLAAARLADAQERGHATRLEFQQDQPQEVER